MHDLSLIGMLQCQDHLFDDVERPFDRNHPAFTQEFERIDSLDKFHREIQIAVNLSRFVNGNNIWVLHLSPRLTFGLKSTHQSLVRGLVLWQNFQSHRPLQLLINGKKDGPHPPGTHLALDFVLPQRRQVVEVIGGTRWW